jgi:hypothetical protein
MKLKDPGIVVATRELILDDAEKVTVLIGKPEPCPDGIAWYCPYQKRGVGLEHVKCAMGIDSVQALIHALSMLGAELYCSDEYQSGRLSWECEISNGDLGFPVTDIIRDVLPGGKQPWVSEE